jgi:hypothetical protein
MQDKLNNRNNLKIIDYIYLNKICLIEYDNILYRGIIIDKNDNLNKCKVLFIDYGNVEIKSYNEYVFLFVYLSICSLVYLFLRVYELDTCYLELPIQVIKCILLNIKYIKNKNALIECLTNRNDDNNNLYLKLYNVRYILFSVILFSSIFS